MAARLHEQVGLCKGKEGVNGGEVICVEGVSLCALCIHGLLLVLRHLLETMESDLDILVSGCQATHSVVSPCHCNDSQLADAYLSTLSTFPLTLSIVRPLIIYCLKQYSSFLISSLQDILLQAGLENSHQSNDNDFNSWGYPKCSVNLETVCVYARCSNVSGLYCASV